MDRDAATGTAASRTLADEATGPTSASADNEREPAGTGSQRAPRPSDRLGPEPRLPALERRWVMRGEPASDEVAALRSSLGLPDVLCKLLAVRGYQTIDAVRPYLKPRLEHGNDAFGLAGMADAVERIARAVRNGENILVHGDYDVDGVTSAALYTRVLRDLGARVVPFVPHRLRDGYDLSAAGVHKALEARASVILTADCGTVAHEPIDQANAAGIDVIVTDHHTPGTGLPAALAVVNPNRADCPYPDKRLAGAGVAFKLCEAVTSAHGSEVEALRYYLDLVALATVADLAPLKGENRIFTRYGLRLLPQTRNPGLRALLRTTGLDQSRTISAGQVGHVLAPRINAVGRMGDANLGVRLLLTEDEDEAARLASEFERQNQIRRATDRQTLAEAVGMLQGVFDPAQDAGVVLAAEGWHPGVIGIVASRVVERVHRPTILIALDPETGTGRGSARSVAGFHLYEAIRANGDLLERFGGHRQAAGLEIRTDRIDAFRDAFNQYADRHLAADDRLPRIYVDVEASLAELADPTFPLLRHFGPFGIGNPAPVFLARRVTHARPWREVGAGHAKMVLAQDDTRLDAIAFSMAELVRQLAGAPMDMLFQLQPDRRTGHAQARVLDLRRAR